MGNDKGKNKNDISGYPYPTADLSNAHGYLLPVLFRLLDDQNVVGDEKRLFEIGCGNGSVAQQLTRRGWNVTGVDPSIEGIAQAHKNHPDIKLHAGSAYDNLVGQYGQFPLVFSLEVIAHVYAPRDYARTVFDLLEEKGTVIISAPYHGYWKNLTLAVIGGMDKHYKPLYDNGFIKFWSMDTLSELLTEAGFVDIRFERAGRVPALAKSMIAIARKP